MVYTYSKTTPSQPVHMYQGQGERKREWEYKRDNMF